MRHLDLFSGIGGFALGLQWAGEFETIGFCEIDKYCQKVLKKRWPDVPVYEDVTTLDYEQFTGQVDIITGGFPCQDISVAGRGAGLSGERSGLYRYLMDAIRVVRPRYAILENVAALLSRGMGEVLGDLAEIGYDAEWHCIPASAVGAPHQRDRVWIMAHSQCMRELQQKGSQQDQWGWVSDSGKEMGNTSGTISERLGTIQDWTQSGLADPSWWSVEPDVGRVAYGIPKRVDRLRGLGNAVVPQVVELLGRAITECQS